MKKIGFVLIASLFLIAWGFYVFAQTPPPAAPADAGIPAVMAPAAGGAPNMGLIKVRLLIL
jgi:hypothetical protein